MHCGLSMAWPRTRSMPTGAICGFSRPGLRTSTALPWIRLRPPHCAPISRRAAPERQAHPTDAYPCSGVTSDGRARAPDRGGSNAENPRRQTAAAFSIASFCRAGGGFAQSARYPITPGSARPDDDRIDVRERSARIRIDRAENGCNQFERRRGAHTRQRSERTACAVWRRSARLAGTLFGGCAACIDEGAHVGRALYHDARRGHDAPAILERDQALHARGGGDRALVSAYAAACVCNAFTEPRR